MYIHGVNSQMRSAFVQAAEPQCAAAEKRAGGRAISAKKFLYRRE